MQPIIKIEDLSKQYRLGTIGTGTIRSDLKRAWYKFTGREDPFLHVGEVNDRTSKANSKFIWALRNINLEIMPGEILGIIGKNGAGKSTLLKILSRVTGPTLGSIKYNGRIGSLLEVGTGFHKELTGRENIYLNGAILGMTKKEIRGKIDEIIDFSGCQKYIDTPVKRYSSGMTVRLGFAVAAHLEPEILVVDEVLAVGDAEFQQKAIGKMQDVSNKDGRTVLFVSHNMASIQKLTQKSILLEKGEIAFQGATDEVIGHYLTNQTKTEKLQNIDVFESESLHLIKIDVDKNHLDRPFKSLLFNLHIGLKRNCKHLRIGVQIFNSYNNRLLTSFFELESPELGEHHFEMVLENHGLPPGHYSAAIGIDINNLGIFYQEEVLKFEIFSKGYTNSFVISRKDKLGVFIPPKVTSKQSHLHQLSNGK